MRWLGLAAFCGACGGGVPAHPSASATSPADGTSPGRAVRSDAGVLRGRVLLDGHPVHHFGVVVAPTFLGPASRSRPRRFRTADGRFELPRVPTGTADIAVVGPGFATYVLDGQRIEPGHVLDLGDIAVEHGVMLVGRVFDTAGGPVPDAIVTIGLRSPWHDVDDLAAIARGYHTATTDEHGRYRFAGLSPSERLRSPGDVVASTKDAISVPRAVPERDATLDLVVLPAGGIDGFVDGMAVPGAVIDARATAPGAGHTSTLLEHDLSFRFGPLLPGTYEVLLRASEGVASPPPVLVVVTAGQRGSTVLRFPLDPITITIDARIPCDEVMLMPGSGIAWLLTTLAWQRCTGGSATITGVTPGRYRLCAGSFQRCTRIEVQPSPAQQHFVLAAQP